MEHINKVTLQGCVGTTRINTIGVDKVLNFTLRTDQHMLDDKGTPRMETAWHNVVVCDSIAGCDVEGICKGDVVKVEGRLRSNRYTSMEGETKTFTEVVAHKFEVIDSI